MKNLINIGNLIEVMKIFEILNTSSKHVLKMGAQD